MKTAAMTKLSDIKMTLGECARSDARSEEDSQLWLALMEQSESIQY
jgi:hypothetical protein